MHEKFPGICWLNQLIISLSLFLWVLVILPKIPVLRKWRETSTCPPPYPLMNSPKPPLCFSSSNSHYSHIHRFGPFLQNSSRQSTMVQDNQKSSVLGHSLVHSLIPLHYSLVVVVCFLFTACFVCAIGYIRCTTFVCSLARSLTPQLAGK